MSANHAFMVEMARRSFPPGARLLDFGCGAGEVVALARAAGFDAHGVDTYQDVWTQYDAAEGAHVTRIAPGAPLPFADARFDGALSNQVFEHVPDLQAAAAELACVIRPGGLLIATLPTREIWREPHLKSWFVHWFAHGSPAQRRALAINHALGQVAIKGQTRTQWVEGGVASLARDMVYRTLPETLAALAPHFRLVRRAEADYAAFRLGPLGRLLAPIVTRLAGVALVLQREG